MKIFKKLSIVILVLALFVGGKFFMTVYAAEYQCDLTKKIRTTKVSTRQSEEIDTLKVGTYNIKSMNYGESVEKFKADVENLDLDVIALQEVDRNAMRSGNADMIQELAKVAGYQYYYFFPTMWILDGYYGLGIVSRYPINTVSSKLLPNSLIKEPRILTKTGLQVGNRVVSIYNTHVTYENNEYRTSQLEYIKKHVESDELSILLGDFNTFGMNGELVMENMRNINSDGQYLTFRTFAAPDNIFYSSAFTVLESGVQSSSFSDHNLLYASFQF